MTQEHRYRYVPRSGVSAERIVKALPESLTQHCRISICDGSVIFAVDDLQHLDPIIPGVSRIGMEIRSDQRERDDRESERRFRQLCIQSDRYERDLMISTAGSPLHMLIRKATELR